MCACLISRMVFYEFEHLILILVLEFVGIAADNFLVFVKINLYESLD